MSSDMVQSVFAFLQLNNYSSLIVFTAVGYDYVLTFSAEMEYIWTKPWTWVSTLFIFVRYAGLCNVALVCLLGSTFIPGTEQVSEILSIVKEWSLLLFLGAADVVMMLRVWAMYNRSRLILGIMLVSIFLEIISLSIYYGIYSNPKNLGEAVIQILDLQICSWGPLPSSVVFSMVVSTFQMVHGAMLCILVVAQFVSQSVQMYGVTKQWRMNRYVNMLAKQGILYFTGIFLIDLLSLLYVIGKFPSGGWQMVALLILEYVPAFTLSPRLILNIRELYARDVQGRRGSAIDTGFGLVSTLDVGGAGIVFADVEQNESEATEVVEDVPLEITEFKSNTRC